jgi:LysR family transcriptional regulator, hydrogen peroxide-inducible genes activator
MYCLGVSAWVSWKDPAMNMQQLRYARALAECGSFVQAANHCGVTQPTLSNGIAQLESELGQQLFARTTRTVRLTEAGTHLLPDIADILNAQAALMARARALSHPERRLMRIGVSPVVSVKFVALVIEPFRLENPDIEVVFREMNLAEMLTLLEGGQLDFVFGPVAATPSGQTAFDNAAFREEPLVFVPSSSTKARYLRAKSVSLKEIAGETFVMVPDTCGLTRTTRALFRQRRLKLKEYSGKAMSYGVLQEWAELGIGSAILPRSKLRESKGAEILIVDGADPLQIRYRSLWQDGPNTMPEVKSLAKFLKEVAPSIVQGLVR